MTPDEAATLIAVLKGAEGAFVIAEPELVWALEALRPWRTVLLSTYLRERFTSPPAVGSA